MLETIREYGLEQLAANGEELGARRRLANYCVQLAQDAGTHLDGSDQESWLARLDADHDNLRATLAWLWETGDAESGLGILEISVAGGSTADIWARAGPRPERF